jgi:membrane protein
MRRAWRFMTDEVWDIELTSLSGLRALGVKAVRVVYLVVRGFHEDECPLHASALTFSTLMSIVPILAISLALARGLGGGDAAKDKLREGISTWTETFRRGDEAAAQAGGADARTAPPELRQAADAAGDAVAGDAAYRPDIPAEIDRLVEEAFNKVENINFAAVSGVGVVVLLLTVVNVLGRVEGAFNRVWGVTAGRSLWRRFADYLSILLVLPILIVAATSLPVVDYATRFFDERTASTLQAFLNAGPLKGLTVLLMSTLSFAFLLTFVPNTRVRARAGLAGGLVTALLFIGWLWLCAMLQVGVARAGRIYGSFAIAPILLAWVHVSWQIILFGAEVSFAVQNCTTYRLEQGASRASMTARIVLALLLLRDAARAMRDPERDGVDLAVFAREHGVSVRFLNDVSAELTGAGMLAELSERSGRVVLLRPPGELTVREVVDVMLDAGLPPRALGLRTIDPALGTAVDRLRGGMHTELKTMAVQDLLEA